MRIPLGELDLHNHRNVSRNIPFNGSKSMRVASYHKLRNVASQPAMHTQHNQLIANKQKLRHHGSRLDLIDNKNLTSFPSLNFTSSGPLNIIEEYFPASVQALHEPIDPYKCQSWSILLQKKLRWRWRIQGLIH